MEIVILKDEEEVVRTAARFVENTVAEKPDAVLGLATGLTMVGLYRELAGSRRFSRVTTFNLDEYVGVAGDEEGSYSHFMEQHFFSRVEIDPRRINLLDGTASDPRDECARYEQAIKRAGGIDLQVLGIGANGHIAFNEPGSSLASRTRLATLTPSTLAANRSSFPREREMPRHVLTMGVGTILEARRCLLLAVGARKAEAVRAMAEGPVTALCPASALQFHPDVVALLDEEAASGLKLSEQYRQAYADKPEEMKY